MCFDNVNNQKEAKIAKKSIKVYKSLQYVGDKITSPYYHNIVWKKGEIKVCNSMSKSPKSPPMEINRGLHSAKTISRAKVHASAVFEAVIPKGSLYWENDSEYVSNALKITSAKPI